MLDPARIRFVYFDLDDTLLDHRGAERAALDECRRRFGAGFGALTLEQVHEVYHRHNAPLWRAYAAGQISRTEVQRRRFQALVDELRLSGVRAEALGSFYLACYARSWRWRRGAEAAFAAVAELHPTGILTNGFSDLQHAKIERFPLLREKSRAVVISEDVGVMKPDPRIFEHAAALARAEPEEILYVGDSLHSDVEAGLAAGWQVAWIDGRPDLAEAAFAFDDWDLLLARLQPAVGTTKAHSPRAPEHP